MRDREIVAGGSKPEKATSALTFQRPDACVKRDDCTLRHSDEGDDAVLSIETYAPNNVADRCVEGATRFLNTLGVELHTIDFEPLMATVAVFQR